MNNPMSYDWVRVAYDTYPDKIQRALDAIAQFSYDTPHDIESRLGEYSGDSFKKDALVSAVSQSIASTDTAGWSSYNSLKRAFEAAGLPESAVKKVQDITTKIALECIDSGIYKNADGHERFHAHGHHARQYISRDVVALAIKDPDICPQ